MKKQLSIIPLLVLIILMFSGCAVVGGIFKAGIWTGIILVALVIGAIIFVISRMGGNNK
ncbi:MAG: phosphatidate cytidylyltransferase [Cytophagales bacterium]|nr:phosphatidate cytidylyltransferase [Cytophaga sp.]